MIEQPATPAAVDTQEHSAATDGSAAAALAIAAYEAPSDGAAVAAPEGGAPEGVGAPLTRRSQLRRWGWLVAGLAIAVLLVIVLAPLASPDPDGLESIAKQQGFVEAARTSAGFLAGYEIPGLGGSTGTIVAGLVGVGVVLLAMLGLGRLLRRRDAARR